MKIGLLCVLFSFIALSVGSALNESLTYDEVFYLEEGRGILSGEVMRDPYNPPLMPILTGIPMVLGLGTFIRSPLSMHTAFPARMVTVGFGVLLIIAVYVVAARLFGSTVGLVASFFLAFDPNILANSHYVTSDVIVTFFFFLAVDLWLRFLRKPSPTRAVLFGLASGYAIGAKITSLVYIMVVSMPLLWQAKGSGSWRWIAERKYMVLMSIATTLLFLWAVYFFRTDVIIAERSDEHRVSSKLLRLNIPVITTAIHILQTKPVPLGGFIAQLKNNVLRGITQGDSKSPWYRILVTTMVKTPIPILILFIIGLCSGLVLTGLKRKRIYMFAMIPVVILCAMIGLRIAPLVRYVLPMNPFVAIVAATSIYLARTPISRVLLVVILVWYALGVVWQYPHFISYANELAGPRDSRHEILSDSNLDWGQSLPDVARYVQNNRVGKVLFSYFGRDDARQYGLPSPTAYGGWKFEEICAFHDVLIDPNVSRDATIISVSNWYSCGYNKQRIYRKEKIRDVAADIFLVF